jgi:CubicO group peptidase (beta-lactamase class C family)
MNKWIIVWLLPFCGVLTAQKADSVDAVIARHLKNQQLTGLSIGIVKEGRVFMTKGYGMANLELQVPATENTVYKLASVSKHMIGTGIMKLVQEGKLSLTDPVSAFFPNSPLAWKEITIRHLMNHTSGLARESPAFNPWKIQPDSMLIKAAYTLPLLFPTGTKWAYCNLGYFMLADIIRQVSGQSFEQFMRESVFVPAGLTHTQVTSSSVLMPNRADGYMLKKDKATERAEDYIALRPSGAFVSNITDMVKWELAIQQNKLLTETNNTRIYMDTAITEGTHPHAPSVPYGYGWSTALYKGQRIVFHSGSLPGFRTMYYRFPEKKTAIIILVNSEPADLTGLSLEIYEKIK